MEKQYQELNNEIIKISTQYEEKILIIIHQTIDLIESKAKEKISFKDFYDFCNQQMKLCEKEIVQLLYECLEKIYALIVKFIKKNYSHIEVEEVNIASLTWNKDGLTLEERIASHIQNSISKLLELYKDGIIDFNIVQKTLDFAIIKIIDNEAYVVSNAVLYNKLKKSANYFQILSRICCELCDDLSGEILPIEQLKEIPPFHPVCKCMIIYYQDKPN